MVTHHGRDGVGVGSDPSEHGVSCPMVTGRTSVHGKKTHVELLERIVKSTQAIRPLSYFNALVSH